MPGYGCFRELDSFGALIRGIGQWAALIGSMPSSVIPAVKSSNPKTLKSASRPNFELSATKKASPATERILRFSSME